MDPFDEFEFKPLTEGLGFHKKKPQSKISKSTEIMPLKAHGLDLLDETDMGQLRPPLPRTKVESSTQTTTADTQVVDEILKTLHHQKQLNFDLKEVVNTPQKEITYRLSQSNFGAIVLDGMLVLASYLLCLLLTLMISKVDLMKNLTHPDDQYMVYIASVGLIFGVSFIYLVVNRVFAGCTPGEWAFDQRIGQENANVSWRFIPRILLRTTLVLATGYILFPVLSLFTGKDFVGDLTGSPLFERR